MALTRRTDTGDVACQVGIVWSAVVKTERVCIPWNKPPKLKKRVAMFAPRRYAGRASLRVRLQRGMYGEEERWLEATRTGGQRNLWPGRL